MDEYGVQDVEERLTYVELATPATVNPATLVDQSGVVTEVIATGGLDSARAAGSGVVEIFPNSATTARFGVVQQATALSAGAGLLDRSAAEVRAAIEVKKIVTGTVSVNPGSIGATSTGTGTGTITGLAVGDVVSLGRPVGLDDDLIFSGCRVTGVDTLTIYLYNPTAAPIDDGSLNWDYAWIDQT